MTEETRTGLQPLGEALRVWLRLLIDMAARTEQNEKTNGDTRTE